MLSADERDRCLNSGPGFTASDEETFVRGVEGSSYIEASVLLTLPVLHDRPFCPSIFPSSDNGSPRSAELRDSFDESSLRDTRGIRYLPSEFQRRPIG